MSVNGQPVLAKDYAEHSYAVNRSADVGSSSQQPQEIEDNDRPNTPPPYSGPTSPSMSQPQPVQSQLQYPGLPRLEYRLYTPATFTLSSDATTITSYEPRYSTYPTALVSLIQSLATVPPKPHIRIVGKSAGYEVIDFDVKINLMNLIVTDDVKRRMNYVKLIGTGDVGFRGETSQTTAPSVTGGLEEWARLFCADSASIKHFALERTVTNWDTSYLEGRLLSLVNNTLYGGRVTVTFPVTHSRVVIRSPDKVNRFFSNVTKVFTGTRKYEVVKSVWPYADVARGEQGRRCAVQDEESFLRNWSDSIKHAILSKRKGWVSVEDRLEFLMEPKESEKGNPAPWGN
ncbi:hypothetical protein OIDMADRAFT_22692 [Oidiodendron maius Zn]|uniref:Uncharacterized protein n=1 Tax=Oidiodendron maius (strain Zn) TaxID=913774 RepID=A0A0C3HY84_OIDMZ|nr:hypothetical protein OIDMADRAFT_22692 [Oidiodendron maius Zn]